MAIDYRAIQEKWQKAWNDAKIFESEPDSRKPLMVFAAEPYVNTPQHIGHFRTYGTADAYARYMSMKGYNVLFPMSWHKTGTPILAIAKRVANKDEDIIKELKGTFHLPAEDIEKMSDPLFIADYFSKEIRSGMELTGLGIDWRRTFSSIDPLFSKMVEWQFRMLEKSGFLTKGRHPIGWCTNENNPVGQHDTKGDMPAEIEEVLAIKFKDSASDAYFLCETYRPETIYGATNLFIKNGAEYVIAEINGEKIFISKAAASIMAYQVQLKVIEEIKADELLNKRAINPVTGDELPILPGFFVRDDYGTGIVMSVPAHAPFDYVALKRLEENGIAVPKEPYKQAIKVEGNTINTKIPSLVYLESFDWKGSALDDSAIEEATKALYREESRHGIELEGEFAGQPEEKARESIKAKLTAESKAFTMYIIGNDEPVYCRCGTKVIVKIVDDQWFIDYGNAAWKESAKKCLSGMSILPDKLRHTFDNVVDWLDLRAAERAQGLGTRFPLNPAHIIESLSDSTIYMAFFTVYHILVKAGAKPENLVDSFFDYVFMSKGTAADAARNTSLDEMVINECKSSFDYWYTFTSSHSGTDLINNHLVMYVFNHVAIFPESKWPKQIVVNGMVNYEGEKMSKSMGNLVPLKDAVTMYGADPLRMVLIAGADLDTAVEFSEAQIGGIKSRNEYLYSMIFGVDSMGSKELGQLDFWLYSKLNSKIVNSTALMDKIMLKGAYNYVYYSSVNEIKKYLDMGGKNGLVLEEYLSAIAKMLYPVMPHVAEEFWHALGKSTLVAKEEWPVPDTSMVNADLEKAYDVIDDILQDISNAIALTSNMPANKGKSVKEVRVIMASKWKLDAYDMLVDKKSISAVIDATTGIDKEKLAKYLSQFKKPGDYVDKIGIKHDTMFSVLSSSLGYMSAKVGARVLLENEDESKSARAARALPLKPSLDLTWG
ncbi:MAG: leucine--tRNA ligase [Candidatus Micrarchaeaceae archaeon]